MNRCKESSNETFCHCGKSLTCTNACHPDEGSYLTKARSVWMRYKDCSLHQKQQVWNKCKASCALQSIILNCQLFIPEPNP